MEVEDLELQEVHSHSLSLDGMSLYVSQSLTENKQLGYVFKVGHLLINITSITCKIVKSRAI